MSRKQIVITFTAKHHESQPPVFEMTLQRSNPRVYRDAITSVRRSKNTKKKFTLDRKLDRSVKETVNSASFALYEVTYDDYEPEYEQHREWTHCPCCM